MTTLLIVKINHFEVQILDVPCSNTLGIEQHTEQGILDLVHAV
jgi:hypothetical protein